LSTGRFHLHLAAAQKAVVDLREKATTAPQGEAKPLVVWTQKAIIAARLAAFDLNLIWSFHLFFTTVGLYRWMETRTP
jgi:hypothetical protein